MATRSRIAIENPDGTVTSVYCHNDGYIEGVGQKLMEHYKDLSKVQKLINLGSLSSISSEIEAPEGHTFDSQVNGIVVAYHRDRGEDLVQKQHKSFKDFFNSDIEEYGYLFTQAGEWWVKSAYGDDQEPITLESAFFMIDNDEEDNG